MKAATPRLAAPLLVSSSYSFHYGTIPPETLARAAKASGYASIALTDRDGIHGAPVFFEACEAAGIRPILGSEILYQGGRALLLVRDREGFAELSRFLTWRAEDEPEPRRGTGPKGTGPKGTGPRGTGLRGTEPGAVREALAALSRTKPGGLALLSDDPALLAMDDGAMALLSPCNRRAWRALLRSGRRPVATGEVRFLEPGDRALQRLLVAIGSGRTVAEVAEAELAADEALLRPPEAAGAAYAQLGEEGEEALAANASLADSCRLASLSEGLVFPRYATDHPGGAAGLLRDFAEAGARARYGGLPPAVRARLDHELAVIGEKGFSDYFLVVRDITRRASRICGRGSAAASVVSYALGITDVDPIKHGLYFERFLNPGRKDPPDIDVDFAWDERDALLAETVAGFGEARAARVANHVRFQPRSALREAARAYGMPDGEIAAFERRLAADRAAALAEADADWREIAELAPRLAGFPRHLGVHSGGLVVVPDELAARLPLERTGSGIRVVAWDKEGVEAAGLVKIDLLGNRSLAVVRDALANLADNRAAASPGYGEGEAFGAFAPPPDDPSWTPLEDPGTIELLARGDTMGVFYVESPAMRRLQIKTGRGDFEHLVIHSSMIRPAANRYIDEYIDRLGGKPYEPLHPLVGDLLAETFGIMCYQEDVCKVAVALAGFTAAEADGIRKVLSKKDAVTRLAAYREQFVEGARSRGVADAAIEEIWKMIESFSGYSFVKAHSASYAMLSFRSAYLRRHFPAEFMAAVISNRGGYYSVLAYASEARRMGLTLLTPDVNASGLRCRGRGKELRFGLGMIGGLGTETAEAIVAERLRGGPFAGPEELAARVRLDRSDAEALAGAGALDGLEPGQPRAAKLMRLFAAVAAAEGRARSGGAELFELSAPGGAERGGGSSGSSGGRGGGDQAAARARERVADSPRRRLEAEMKYLGTTLAVHPLNLWPEAMSRPRTLARDLPRLVGRRVELLSWPVTAKEVLTAAAEPMEFVSFEDETALYEAVLFPEAFRRFKRHLFEERPLLVRGLVEEDRGAVGLTVGDIVPLEESPGSDAKARAGAAFGREADQGLR